MTDSQTQVITKPAIMTKPREPLLFDVVFFNDNKTYFEFVVLILVQLFSKDYDTATELTKLIHKKGRAVVATYTYEIASAKRDEVITTARTNGHPLRVEIQPTGSTP